MEDDTRIYSAGNFAEDTEDEAEGENIDGDVPLAVEKGKEDGGEESGEDGSEPAVGFDRFRSLSGFHGCFS